MSDQGNIAVMPAPGRRTRYARPGVRAVPVASRAPSARSRLLLIAAFLLPVSLIPATRGIVFNLPLLPNVSWKVNFILLFALVVFLFRACIGFRPRPVRSTRRWFLLPFLALAALQVVSLLWNGRDNFMRSYSFLQTLAMCAAILSGVWLASGLPRPTRLRLARGIILLLAFVTAVYMGLSFLLPSWRPSSAWMDWTTGTLGFIRVFGPLGKSTSLVFVLVPALGFAAGMIFLPGRARAFWIPMTLFFLVALLATGSRGAVLSLLVFGILLMLSLRIRSAMFLMPVGLFLASLLAFTGIPERYRDFQDRARTETYRTAIRTFAASPRNVMVGAGHGAIYSALHDGSLRKMSGKSRWYLLETRTRFGYSLRNSHTALLRTLAETGVIGFTLLAVPLLWIVRRLIFLPFRNTRDPRRTHASCALAGCAAVMPYMMLEEFFVGAFWIVFLWTVFTVVGMECAAGGAAAKESQ